LAKGLSLTTVVRLWLLQWRVNDLEPSGRGKRRRVDKKEVIETLISTKQSCLDEVSQLKPTAGVGGVCVSPLESSTNSHSCFAIFRNFIGTGRSTTFPFFIFGRKNGLLSEKPFEQKGTRRPGLCQQRPVCKQFYSPYKRGQMKGKVNAGKSVAVRLVRLVLAARARRARLATVSVAVVLLFAPVSARAMTADGALMTNTALATFSGLGGQTLMYRTSYLASVNVLICNPVILYVKTATPSMAAPTATVTFTVCTINNSITTSAFNIIITDQIPGNMGFIAETEKWPLPVTSVWGPAVTGPWSAAVVPAGQTSSFLQWKFNQINVGPGRSACVTYTASVL